MSGRPLLRALVVSLFLLATVGCSTPKTPQNANAPIVEAFGTERLEKYRGQVVVLNLWAIWCMPCRSEMPDLQAVYEQYQDRGAVIVGLNVTESSEDILAFAHENGITFPLFRDVGQEFMKANDVRVLPTTFFVDREGQIQSRKLGAMSKDLLVEQIEALLE
jgi:thiol-disulfide isomerase/thioredoxin